LIALLGETPDLDINFEKGFAFDTKPVDLKEKIALALQITALAKAQEDQASHFGNNDLAKNFFWYKANN
jgi:hypothetical protein